MVPLRKNTTAPPPPECPLTNCIQFVAKAWTANIIWHLGGTPRRFNELRFDLKGISAKMLAERLKELHQAGVVLRHERATSPPTVEYELTQIGRELLVALQQVVNIGHRLKAVGEVEDAA